MIRVGIGYDVHQFATDRRLILGGVLIPHHIGLLGHSDADVLVHAIADAILGTLALGDIGEHFPPTAPRFLDANSLDLLRQVGQMIEHAGYIVGNVDATLIVEAPKIMPHALAMRKNIADTLGVEVGRVSVKATTNERMGFVGREEGIAAIAIAAVEPVEQAG